MAQILPNVPPPVNYVEDVEMNVTSFNHASQKGYRSMVHTVMYLFRTVLYLLRAAV